jgi:hypothetical protein
MFEETNYMEIHKKKQNNTMGKCMSLPEINLRRTVKGKGRHRLILDSVDYSESPCSEEAVFTVSDTHKKTVSQFCSGSFDDIQLGGAIDQSEDESDSTDDEMVSTNAKHSKSSESENELSVSTISPKSHFLPKCTPDVKTSRRRRVGCS